LVANQRRWWLGGASERTQAVGDFQVGGVEAYRRVRANQAAAGR
jgi:hypothetical protein